MNIRIILSNILVPTINYLKNLDANQLIQNYVALDLINTNYFMILFLNLQNTKSKD